MKYISIVIWNISLSPWPLIYFYCLLRISPWNVMKRRNLSVLKPFPRFHWRIYAGLPSQIFLQILAWTFLRRWVEPLKKKKKNSNKKNSRAWNVSDCAAESGGLRKGPQNRGPLPVIALTCGMTLGSMTFHISSLCVSASHFTHYVGLLQSSILIICVKCF